MTDSKVPEFVWIHPLGGVITSPPESKEWTRYRLTPAPEPLRFEGTCEWYLTEWNSDGSSLLGKLIYPAGPDFRTRLAPFIGKRTKITVEEIP